MWSRIACLALALGCAALPARAWVAGVDGAICTLEHRAEGVEVRLTHDPSLPLYTIAIRLDRPWPEAPVFAIRFEGPRGLTISTRRHAVDDGGRRLSVADTGFGNVLDGLQFGDRALAVAGDRVVTIDLAGAEPEVAAFRACRGATS